MLFSIHEFKSNSPVLVRFCRTCSSQGCFLFIFLYCNAKSAHSDGNRHTGALANVIKPTSACAQVYIEMKIYICGTTGAIMLCPMVKNYIRVQPVYGVFSKYDSLLVRTIYLTVLIIHQKMQQFMLHGFISVLFGGRGGEKDVIMTRVQSFVQIAVVKLCV